MLASSGARCRRSRLLLQYDENSSFWATPGGSLEPGEAEATATLRELREELRIDEHAVELGVQLAERSKDQLVDGLQIRQVETYFLTRFSAAAVAVAPARWQMGTVTSHAVGRAGLSRRHRLVTGHAGVTPISMNGAYCCPA
ncbi:NUDIX domain-containing protein [Streptomyces sp. NPDC012935]|uniref:NUDIX domain-containing protein n=1 Tax=Streptomyces sp. NPDC012935 TaxID=3364857 RepID=UPI00368B51C8